jgi:hypothetical protein
MHCSPVTVNGGRLKEQPQCKRENQTAWHVLRLTRESKEGQRTLHGSRSGAKCFAEMSQSPFTLDLPKPPRLIPKTVGSLILVLLMVPVDLDVGYFKPKCGDVAVQTQAGDPRTVLQVWYKLPAKHDPRVTCLCHQTLDDDGAGAGRGQSTAGGENQPVSACEGRVSTCKE